MMRTAAFDQKAHSRPSVSAAYSHRAALDLSADCRHEEHPGLALGIDAPKELARKNS
jgi:hypothetical protein